MSATAGPDDTAGAAAESMSTAAALRLVATLPSEQAEAVLLRVIIGLDAATAGRVIGKRPGAVRMATHRGLRTLARRLEPTAIGRPAADGVTAAPPDALNETT